MMSSVYPAGAENGRFAMYTLRMAQPIVKEELLRLVESLPEDATWEDLKYLVYVREQVEAGRRSAREGRLLTTEEVFDKYDLGDE